LHETLGTEASLVSAPFAYLMRGFKYIAALLAPELLVTCHLSEGVKKLKENP
jgi:hypothetical protein